VESQAVPAEDTVDEALALHEVTSTTSACMSLRLIVATAMTEDPFTDFAFDGVLGLGLPGLSQAPEFNFVEMAGRAREAIGGQGDYFKRFAVFLATSDNEQSELTFGGWRQEHFASHESGHELLEPAWCDVREPEHGYWQIDVFGITANGHKLDYCGQGEGQRCRAILDTGTSLLGVPGNLGVQLSELLSFTRPSKGSCAQPGPQLEIDLGHFTMTLDPVDYARPEEVEEADEVADRRAVDGVHCVPMVMHIDLPQPMLPRTLILGEPVLQKYYTVFDAHSSPRIGFGLARHEQGAAAESAFQV